MLVWVIMVVKLVVVMIFSVVIFIVAFLVVVIVLINSSMISCIKEFLELIQPIIGNDKPM